ncbi:hypothetical protein [Fluviispira multicolorata]|uniref:Uncharacterized protein n=1 Tax=Fluviispira multicolorata TaxID=2654512 RepID=A0A833JBG2_9BACT|nr:hypothetical protein [Fluviispira multicolorata]KAB8029187.1 hypothetical protein GCL57_11665 [Fluviispira multicolorata]
MRFIKRALTLSIVLFNFNSAFADGFTLPLKPNTLKCDDEGLDPQSCTVERDEALKIGCIGKAVYDELIRINHFPMCTSTKKFKGYCSCFASTTKIYSFDKN